MTAAPEDRRRRIPLHLIAGVTEEETDAFRLAVLLGEVDRQADLFNRSFADALRAAAADDSVTSGVTYSRLCSLPSLCIGS